MTKFLFQPFDMLRRLGFTLEQESEPCKVSKKARFIVDASPLPCFGFRALGPGIPGPGPAGPGPGPGAPGPSPRAPGPAPGAPGLGPRALGPGTNALNGVSGGTGILPP